MSLSLCLLVDPIAANDNYSVSNDELSDIETRVNSMSVKQLNARYAMLKTEQRNLMNNQEGTSNTETESSSSSASKRLAEIAAELSAIQKALIAVLGLGAISALTDDGYDDTIPPVITINGENPATVELGSTYTDAGATAKRISWIYFCYCIRKR